jgi:hypothetical protein
MTVCVCVLWSKQGRPRIAFWSLSDINNGHGADDGPALMRTGQQNSGTDLDLYLPAV